ncbi:hypothetical protein EYF80_011842 [Liparis tanakae]|uniref:Uncharacterized protein n=1 Tax=Liparis tanakae TaxID=230148 RepID=A0A4Z2IIW9_9TELE|nr:hypothetical protein EYF80_011842 [Liparis tanakae]
MEISRAEDLRQMSLGLDKEKAIKLSREPQLGAEQVGLEIPAFLFQVDKTGGYSEMESELGGQRQLEPSQILIATRCFDQRQRVSFSGNPVFPTAAYRGGGGRGVMGLWSSLQGR